MLSMIIVIKLGNLRSVDLVLCLMLLRLRAEKCFIQSATGATKTSPPGPALSQTHGEQLKTSLSMVPAKPEPKTPGKT